VVLRFWNRATAIVKMPEGILLVKHFFPKRFGLLGGRIKRKEKPENAVVRELIEETGLKVKNVNYLFDYNYWHQSHKVFLIKATGKVNLNWELIGYGFLGKIDEREVGASARKIIDKFEERKWF